MSLYTVGQASARSGFSASALRYYDGVGLVEPVRRTAAGYRLYDDHSIERLLFIGRAKQLGCTLDEAADLLAILDGERCRAVQRRFHELLTDKISTADAQITELESLAAQLRATAEQLRDEPLDGPCSPDCACVALGRPTGPSPIAVGTEPAVRTEIPVACTLEPASMPHRIAEWATALVGAVRPTPIDGGVRIELPADTDLGTVGRLVAAEQRCCAFFHFTLTVDATATTLDVRAPELAADVITVLFGPAA